MNFWEIGINSDNKSLKKEYKINKKQIENDIKFTDQKLIEDVIKNIEIINVSYARLENNNLNN